eukprot:scaffold6931_cov45-Phaeocystis_antarctica.AAC.3
MSPPCSTSRRAENREAEGHRLDGARIARAAHAHAAHRVLRLGALRVGPVAPSGHGAGRALESTRRAHLARGAHVSGAILAAAVLTLHSVEEPTAVGLLQTRLAHPAVLAAVALVTAILDQQLERHGRHGGCRALQGGDRASPVAWGARHLGEWEASSLALVVIVTRGTGEGGDEARADEG